MTSEQMNYIHGMIQEVLTPCIANLNAITARLQASTIRLRAKLEELHQLQQKRVRPASERCSLPKRKKLEANQRLELETGEVMEFPKARTVRTGYLRRDYLERDVAFSW